MATSQPNPIPSKRKARLRETGTHTLASSQPTIKAMNHSQRTRDVVSGNTARNQKTNRAGKKKHPRLEVTQAHQNIPSATQQTESSTSHSTQSSGVNPFPPNARYHSGRKWKRAKTITYQTPEYIEPDTDTDGQGKPVHLSDCSSDEYHVSLLEGKTEPDTEINKEDLACYHESAAWRPVQPRSHGSGNKRAKAVRISTCSESQDVAIPLRTTGSGVIITPCIPIRSQTFLSSSLIRYSFSLSDPNTLTESVIRSSSPLSERSSSGRTTIRQGINSQRNTVTGSEGEILSVAKTLTFRYTLFVDLLPNPIALTSEVYRVWNRA